MAEYIEREALRSKAVYMYGFGKKLYVPLRTIEDAPAADVAPVVHGRWVRYRSGADRQCTRCNWSIDFDIPLNFCPNCGARMDGDE